MIKHPSTHAKLLRRERDMRIQAACWALSSGVFGALPMLGFLSCVTQDAVKYEVACAHKCNNHYSYIYIHHILCGHFMLSQHSIYQSHGYNNNCNHYSYIYIYTIYYVAISCLASILYTSRMATTTIAIIRLLSWAVESTEGRPTASWPS